MNLYRVGNRTKNLLLFHMIAGRLLDSEEVAMLQVPSKTLKKKHGFERYFLDHGLRPSQAEVKLAGLEAWQSG